MSIKMCVLFSFVFTYIYVRSQLHNELIYRRSAAVVNGATTASIYVSTLLLFETQHCMRDEFDHWPVSVKENWNWNIASVACVCACANIATRTVGQRWFETFQFLALSNLVEYQHTSVRNCFHCLYATEHDCSRWWFLYLWRGCGHRLTSHQTT